MDDEFDPTWRGDQFLPFLHSDASRTIEGLEFYLRTLEKFIDDERKKEVTDLEKEAHRLPEEARPEFWADHYPVHWDEIFATQLRSSFVVTAVSLAESNIRQVAEEAYGIASAQLKPADLRGDGGFERNRKFLEALAGFRGPAAATWTAVLEVRDIRNCIVHANSQVQESRSPDRIRDLARRLPGIKIEHEVIEMASEFPAYALSTVRNFVNELYAEAAELWKRKKAWRA